MTTTTAGRAPADPVLSAALAAAWLLLQLRPLALALIALVLTLAGWRPAAAAAPASHGLPAASPAIAIEAPLAAEPVAIARPSGRVTVAELRRLARAAGLPRSLTRSGRRAELLTALGMEA